jgi:hypothetical protein
MASGFQYDAIADACDWTHEMKDGRIIGTLVGEPVTRKFAEIWPPGAKLLLGESVK